MSRTSGAGRVWRAPPALLLFLGGGTQPSPLGSLEAGGFIVAALSQIQQSHFCPIFPKTFYQEEGLWLVEGCPPLPPNIQQPPHSGKLHVNSHGKWVTVHAIWLKVFGQRDCLCSLDETRTQDTQRRRGRKDRQPPERRGQDARALGDPGAGRTRRASPWG